MNRRLFLSAAACSVCVLVTRAGAATIIRLRDLYNKD
jgi:hypothetical protein